jgi:hypothetical protein
MCNLKNVRAVGLNLTSQDDLVVHGYQAGVALYTIYTKSP